MAVGCSQEDHLPNCSHFGYTGGYLSRHEDYCPWSDVGRSKRTRDVDVECTCNPTVRKRRANSCPYLIVDLWSKRKGGEWVFRREAHVHPDDQPHSPKRVEYRNPRLCGERLEFDLRIDDYEDDAPVLHLVCPRSREPVWTPLKWQFDWDWAQPILQDAFEEALIREGIVL